MGDAVFSGVGFSVGSRANDQVQVRTQSKSVLPQYRQAIRVPENAPSPICVTLSVPWIIVSGHYQKVHSPMNSTVSDNVTSRTPDSTKRCRRWQLPASPGFLREWPPFRPRLRRRIERWTLQGHSPPVQARSPADKSASPCFIAFLTFQSTAQSRACAPSDPHGRGSGRCNGRTARRPRPFCPASDNAPAPGHRPGGSDHNTC